MRGVQRRFSCCIVYRNCTSHTDHVNNSWKATDSFNDLAELRDITTHRYLSKLPKVQIFYYFIFFFLLKFNRHVPSQAHARKTVQPEKYIFSLIKIFFYLIVLLFIKILIITMTQLFNY